MRPLLTGACTLLLAACGTASPPAVVSGASASPASPVSPASPAAAVPSAAVPVVAGAPAITTCLSPAEYAVDHPAGWAVNPVGVLPPCRWFGPESFVVPEASDVRTAPITFEVLPVPFAEATVASPDETSRTAVEVDGRPGVRIELVSGPGLYPEGTPITTYAVDLGERTLVADAVGLPPTDHPRDVAVLDAMVASLEFDVLLG